MPSVLLLKWNIGLIPATRASGLATVKKIDAIRLDKTTY